MERLEIRLFGGLGLCLGGKPLKPFPTRDSEVLFSYLVLNRDRLVSRDHLAARIYANLSSQSGRKKLRTTLWRIRSILEPTGVPTGTYLTVRNREVGFNQDCNYWLDVQDFERRINNASSNPPAELVPDHIRSLSNAVTLYRGDLLEGQYHDWCIWQQERMKLLLLDAIERLMKCSAAIADWPNALLYGYQLIASDPLREHVHRDIMRFHYLNGDRPAALHQYDRCVRILKSELGIRPMRETEALRDAIASERFTI